MSRALNATGHEMWFALCDWGEGNPWCVLTCSLAVEGLLCAQSTTVVVSLCMRLLQAVGVDDCAVLPRRP